MTFSNKSIKTFINEYILKCETIDDILIQCQNPSEKGYIYERLWDLVIKFGIHPDFPNNKYEHLLKNLNNAKIKELTSLKHYIENNTTISGNSGGCSDISLRNKETEKYIFMSSKYPKTNEEKERSKLVDYYSVKDIISITVHNNTIYKNFDIYVLVSNKKKVLETVKRSKSTSEHITKYLIEEKIFDKNDLHNLFRKLKFEIQKYTINQYDEIFLGVNEKLSFPFHQRLVERKTSNLISQNNKTILWGCKPRSGKTYMTGKLILAQSEQHSKYNVLIITPAPTETSPQFTDDLFKKYRDFEKFEITHIKSSKDINTCNFDDNYNIIIVSKQLLQM